MEEEERYFVLLAQLLSQLHQLSWVPGSSQRKASYSVPYKTLLQQLNRHDLIQVLEKRQGNDKAKQRVIQTLRGAEQVLKAKIREEIQGAPYTLIPVLTYFEEASEATNLPTTPNGPTTNGPTTPTILPKGAGKPNEGLPTIRLECIAGATNSLRRTTKFGSAAQMAEWFYCHTLVQRKPLLSDEMVGQWLGAFAPDINCTLIPKLLRLEEASSQREVLLIFDVNRFAAGLGFQGVDSYVRLAALLAVRWNEVKSQFAHNKRELMADVSDPSLRFDGPEWQSLTPPQSSCSSAYVSANALRQMVPQLFKLPAHMLSCAKACLGLPKQSQFQLPDFSQLQTTADVARFFGLGLLAKNGTVQIPAAAYLTVGGDLRLCLHGSVEDRWNCFFSPTLALRLPKMLQSDRLPADAQAAACFVKTGKVPAHLGVDAHGIYVSKCPSQRLDFAWYQQQANGIIDTEQLFIDIYHVLKTGGPRPTRSDSKTISFAQIARSLGFLGAMRKLIDVGNRDSAYPEHVVPIFDLQYLATKSQTAAYEIHRLTGRFAHHIIGYFNRQTAKYARLRDLCPKKRSGGGLDLSQIRDDIVHNGGAWITPVMRRHFSAKELCLLAVSVFKNNDYLNDHSTSLRLGDPDVDALFSHASDSRITLLAMHGHVAQMPELRSQTKFFLTRYLQMLMETEGPFIVLTHTDNNDTDNSDNNTIHHELTDAVLRCESTTIEWYVGDEPKPITFLDLPPSGGEGGWSHFRRWIARQARLRQQRLPRVPCPVRLAAETNIECCLVVFDQERDRWHIWNAASQCMGEYSRKDFDIIEETRCLPAPVEMRNGGGRATATKRCNRAEQLYWIELDGGVMAKMMLGKDFEWSSSVFYDSREELHTLSAAERTPELVAELFNADSEFRYQPLSDWQPLPGAECQDWAMREFFAKRSPNSIWVFIRFLQLQVEVETLYHVYFLSAAIDDKDWAVRSRKHVVAACRWFWERIATNQVTYDTMVWQSKLAGKQYAEDTFQWIMGNLYSEYNI